MSKGERIQAAFGIWNARNTERDPSRCYIINRTWPEYFLAFLGLEALIRHVSLTPTLPTTVLEVGVGNGDTHAQLQSKYPSILWTGTCLRRKTVTNPWTHDRVRSTSAEVLRGFPTASIGAIIGYYSIAYARPPLASHRMDQVLAPGGVIKTVLPEIGSRHGMYADREYIELWVRMGYDVSTFSFHHRKHSPHFSLISRGRSYVGIHQIVIAVKPDRTGEFPITAEELFRWDVNLLFDNYPSSRANRDAFMRTYLP